MKESYQTARMLMHGSFEGNSIFQTSPGGWKIACRITCSSSGSGEPSNMRRSTWGPMTTSRKRALRLADTSTASTTPVDLIRALTGRRQMRPILPRSYQSRWRPDRGRNPLKKTRNCSNKPSQLFHSHSALKIAFPRQFIRAKSNEPTCPVKRSALHVLWNKSPITKDNLQNGGGICVIRPY